ncbi:MULTISPECIES: phage holin family protein [unclassified Wenzhouxiangella]|uniref:phage holin family protein n=1 Tax=unclassified Wenzhouxiangella TaxID=2613841 RepID=UPI000E327DF6|nr:MULTISPECIES: phage holin family protein [unclassified Wenzhouxiangella]RFF27277.1 hypothetical protein DZK25_08835 [Wenzhouxiangella sp. 15181]RFP69265.1 hypothetical protein DZK26_04585 [Wenzhouxiangella sp. 15190]
MLKKLKRRIETGALVTALIVPLALCVFAFLSLAGYFAFSETLPPKLAALVTAACGIVLIALILVIARIANAGRGGSSRSTARSDREDLDLGEDFENFLREHADPVLSDWVRNHPDRAAIATLALGIAAGYSDRFRHVLMDLYSRYSESESLRRSQRQR